MNKVLFLLLCMILIYLLYCTIRPIIEDRYERVTIAFSLFIIVLSFLSLVLVIFNQYSLKNILIFLVLLCIMLFIYAFKAGLAGLNIGRLKFNLDFKNIIVAIILLALIGLYMGFPTQYILGGRDPGLYLNFGVHIAQTGGLNLNDPLLNELHVILGDSLRLGYPGIYSGFARGLTEDPATLIPQFMHLFPALIANGYSLFGMEGLLRFNGFIGVLLVLVIYFFTKRISNQYAAIIAAIVVALNPAQIWNVRITLTETFSALIYFTALILLVIAYKKDSRLLFSLSGLIFGIGCFNRVDSYILGIAVLMVAAASFLCNKKIFMYFCITYFICEILSILYGYYYSYPYFYDLWTRGMLFKLFLLHIVALIIFLMAYVFAKFKLLTDFDISLLRSEKLHKYIIYLGIFFLIFLYLIRPAISVYIFNVSPDDYNYFKAFSFVQFSWYMPLFITMFSVFGLFVLLKDMQKGYLLFLIAGFIAVAGYFYDPSITPDHIWASRRWVSISMPTLAILSSIGIANIRIKALSQKSIVCILIIFYVLFSFDKSSPFFLKSMLNNYEKDYRNLSSNISGQSLVLTNNAWIASPLKLIYEKNAYLFSFKDDFDFKQLLEKFNVVLAIDESKGIISNLFTQQVKVLDKGVFPIRGQYLEKVKNDFPSKLYDRTMNINLYKIEESKGDSEFIFYASNNLFYNQIGERQGRNLVSNGEEGFLIYGPYCNLPAGNYKLIIDGEVILGDNKIGFVDVCYNKGQDVIISKDISTQDAFPVSVNFQVGDVEDVEFRLYIYKNIKIKVNSITLERSKVFEEK